MKKRTTHNNSGFGIRHTNNSGWNICVPSEPRCYGQQSSAFGYKDSIKLNDNEG